MMDNKSKILAAMFWYLVNGRELNRTVVNKLLFFSDAYSFIETGRSLSSVDYIKKPFGPVPAIIDDVRSMLLGYDYIEENVYSYSNYMEYGYITKHGNVDKVKVDINNGDTQILDKVIASLSQKTAAFLSEITHKYEPWKSSCWDSVLDFNSIEEPFRNWMKSNIH
ncbi:MAG: SocA family protein [Spirochaetes bacterium]|nr:SocA family protein [Spirochaetota bacterium]MBN2770104.1 SocA family protein [Spirochaetota bacterium]